MSDGRLADLTDAPEDRFLDAGGSRKRIAICGLDNLSRKNRPQIACFNERGYVFDVFTNDSLGDSSENLPAGNSLYLIERSAPARVVQLIRYIGLARRSLHHVEVYPGGRFAWINALIARLAGVPVLTVERGDLLNFKEQDILTRLSMRLCYRLASVVWYRELYHGRALQSLTRSPKFLLANAVALSERPPAIAGRTVDFAWVNRLIPQRKATWVVRALARPELADAGAEMLGLLSAEVADAPTLEQQAYVETHCPPNLSLQGYGDPKGLFRRARFFLLPSDVVFCNNALLEAMAHGVVPLVSDVEGARLIVDDGVDGFVFEHREDGLVDAMTRALSLTQEAYARMSDNAVAKVRGKFSLAKWCDTLDAEYRSLVEKPRYSEPSRRS